MKNKYLLMIGLAAGTLLASCDMDKEPYDSLPSETALQTPHNFSSARVGLYSALKASTAGTFYNAPEIQCDGFNAVTGFSNTLGDMYRWTFDSQTTTFETVYGNYQAIISRANYIIDSYNKTKFSNKNLFPDEATKQNPGMPVVKAAKGDAFFSRAYAIFGLAQYFCANYDEATANQENSGVSYTTKYAPSDDPSTYPGRYTLAQTYQQIYDDLDSAAVYVTTKGQANIPLISVDAITALRARVALAQGDYEKAGDEAELLINSGTYSLANGAEGLQYLWWTSSTWQNGGGGKETILLFNCTSLEELPAQTGIRYLPYSTGAVPDYIPTQEVVDLFSDKDYRKDVYFDKLSISTTTGSAGTVYVLNKYEDKGILYQAFSGTEGARFAVEPRVFRIAEMYLIAAEAYAQQGDLETAAGYLNDLKKKRIQGYTAQNYSDKEIFMTALKEERQREMLAEGTRLFDLKRWHMGIKRGTPQQRDLCLLPGTQTTDLNVPAGSNRMVWPIPKHEIDVNKKVKQNPGY
ncbi:MAG: RagB/SusD family nutrient uptake outer membrane protein [Prevotella sp.]|uniref:RagB/SusD family nutrient uptake outer membrane protein n=1 Tax=Prevotella sp. TaxID=59823 RepID=UPI0025D4A944|nr:RagB/SusD family nutrient uptake outer membrane protein [Prevotella sp.]MCI7120020.1 RagB/SusD family nutrient uptake outer membrane protein [Prevotella sp.]